MEKGLNLFLRIFFLIVKKKFNLDTFCDWIYFVTGYILCRIVTR